VCQTVAFTALPRCGGETPLQALVENVTGDWQQVANPNARGNLDHFTHLIRGFGFGCGFNTHWLMTNMRTALDRFLTDCLPVIVGSRRCVLFT
jgi:hypothetical protein